MGRQAVIRRLGEKLTLPSLPEIVEQISAMAEDPEIPPREVGSVVARDPGITAKVLRIANSAYYGLREPVISPEQAAAVIGMQGLRNIALQASVIQRFEHLAGAPDFDLDEFWTHAVFTAQLAQALSRQLRVSMAPADGGRSRVSAPEEFYTCGLLHDLGKVVLFECLRDEYIQVVRSARSAGEALHLAEERTLRFTHIDVGGLVAARWKMPEPVTHAIEFHHGPKCEILAHPATAVVALSDQLAYRLDTEGFEEALPKLASLAAQALKMDEDAFLEFARGASDLRALVEV